ncbi:YceK/YidQ family lipoprotein [Methylomonas methanica]
MGGIAKQRCRLRKFNIAPPRYPLVDFPFSFALDSLFFPLAVSTEIFH